MIEVKHLSKTFGSRFTRKNCVLNDVSFNLPDKGLVAIFGKLVVLISKTRVRLLLKENVLLTKIEIIFEIKKLVLFSKTIILSMAIQLVKLCIIL